MEETKLNKFQQYIQQNSAIVGVFVVVQIFFVIILIFIISNSNDDTYEPANIPISNLQQDLENLPENSLDVVESMLYDTIASNGGTLDSINNSDAKVRENSMTDLYFENINMHYVNFIVDIPSIQQSYQIFNEWSDDRTNPNYLTNMVTMIMCLPKGQEIYTNFNCKDDQRNNGQKILVSKFIGYFDFSNFTPFFKKGDLSTIYINPINFNQNDATKESYIQETKTAIQSLGISPDIFTYHIVEANELDYNIPAEYR